MERQEWLEARRKGIGGSDIAAVAGLSRWKSPMDVYLDKIGAAPDRELTAAMRWGTRLEAFVCEHFSDEHHEFMVMTDVPIIADKEHPYRLANVDALLLSGPHYVAGWEGKTSSAWNKSEWDGDTPPIEYVLQCQWYMGVSGLPRWYLSVLIGGNDYREWVIERDEEIITDLRERAAAFWRLVEDRTPPAIDGTQATSRVLAELYPAEDAVLDPPLQLEDEVERYAQAVVEAKERVKDAQASLRLAENELKAAMGEHAVGITPGGWEVTWKPVHKDEYVVKAQDYRVLRVKEPKEGAE